MTLDVGFGGALRETLERPAEIVLAEAGSGGEAAVAQSLPQPLVTGERSEPIRQRLGSRLGVEDQAVLAVAQVLARAAEPGGHDGSADRHGLQRDEDPWLLPANREDDRDRRGVERRELFAGTAGELDPLGKTKRRDTPVELGLVARVAGAGYRERRFGWE